MKLSQKFDLHPALSLPFGICMVTGFISLLVVGYIEEQALHDPMLSATGFTHPHHIKSVVVFFSDRQEWLWNIFNPLMLGSFAIMFVLTFASLAVHIRNKRKAR